MSGLSLCILIHPYIGCGNSSGSYLIKTIGERQHVKSCIATNCTKSSTNNYFGVPKNPRGKHNLNSTQLKRCRSHNQISSATYSTKSNFGFHLSFLLSVTGYVNGQLSKQEWLRQMSSPFESRCEDVTTSPTQEH